MFLRDVKMTAGLWATTQPRGERVEDTGGQQCPASALRFPRGSTWPVNFSLLRSPSPGKTLAGPVSWSFPFSSSVKWDTHRPGAIALRNKGRMCDQHGQRSHSWWLLLHLHKTEPSYLLAAHEPRPRPESPPTYVLLFQGTPAVRTPEPHLTAQLPGARPQAGPRPPSLTIRVPCLTLQPHTSFSPSLRGCQDFPGCLPRFLIERSRGDFPESSVSLLTQGSGCALIVSVIFLLEYAAWTTSQYQGSGFSLLVSSL